ncbi:hypothetical protein AAHA92_28440 [Salvia divinorum]|uniref:RRM domain-containing protein n=1 Tax=Salvia divinorum TaxID=28513 RepID=A0ABD1FV31_SALDI
MVGSVSRKEIYGNTNEMPLEDFLDGTSARTRPMSYDEIMLRRKNKRDAAQQVSSSTGAAGSELAQDNMERAYDIPEGLSRIRYDSKPLVESQNINDTVKARSGRKGDINASRKNEKLVQDNDDRSLYPDAKSKEKRDRIPRRNRVPDEKFEGRNQGSRKKDDLLSVNSDKGLDKRKYSESYKQDRVSERSRVKFEIVKVQPHNEERQVDRKRKSDDQIGSDSDNEYKKRNMSDVCSTRSKDKRELAEPSSHSTKDKSGREHSNVDNKRIPSNGSDKHYRRNANNSSGLGGYSPRKRKTEAAAKTPSPTSRSSEKRAAGWDLLPVEKESAMATSTPFNLNAMSQKSSLYNTEYPTITPVPPTVVKPILISLHTISSQLHAVESIQLTQATKPKRRLYIENLPLSASEKDLIGCINKCLLSSGVNYVQGTQPCIGCTIHKEKSQALLEFLTPEDASAALSLDGISFSGSNLKLRRPKDYANVTTGSSDKSVPDVDSINGIVEDSPHKIFVGGLSKLLSSRMFLEIARAFGLVKAFHFERISDTNEPCAFLEYVDHLVTSKACAGLNGMMLGGQVLTAVLATPEPDLKNAGQLPTYAIPEHAKPLIKKPATILQLKNVFNPSDLLSESELEEILEDIRLECSRFGMVRSINVAKKTNAFGTMECNVVSNTSACTDAYDFQFANRSHGVEQLSESTSGLREFEKSKPVEAPNKLENNSRPLEEKNGCDYIAISSDVSSGSLEPKNIARSGVVDESLSNEITAGNSTRDEVCEQPLNGEDASFKEPPRQPNPSDLTGEVGNQRNTTDTELISNCNNSNSTSVMSHELETKPSTKDLKSEDHNAKLQSSVEGDRNDAFVDPGDIFEPGSVIVEYRRLEAACMAAHCLHGRTFDGRVVTVEYVGHDLHQMGFCR